MPAKSPPPLSSFSFPFLSHHSAFSSFLLLFWLSFLLSYAQRLLFVSFSSLPLTDFSFSSSLFFLFAFQFVPSIAFNGAIKPTNSTAHATGARKAKPGYI
ncbi:Uncharacterized protein TCM_018448 [Theobroma cacao]|uniref:Uncharacterized protein n=1 Tax=Theobroma cacao TaxID=3641 RepID=A0A061EM64_THECC|nr:Uncharacterized protein TCM_018448 [Theobroma cacao]